jgi:hypothetical protein
MRQNKMTLPENDQREMLSFTKEVDGLALVAEAYYNSHGQLSDVRFIKERTLPDGNPAKDYLAFNIFSFFANSNQVSTSLESMLKSQTDKAAKRLHKTGVKLLKKNGIFVPKVNQPCPEMAEFHQQLSRRPAITRELAKLTWEHYYSFEGNDTLPEKPVVDRIVAFTNYCGGKIARVKDIRFMKFHGGSREWEMTTLPTEVTTGHVSYGFGSHQDRLGISDHKADNGRNRFNVRMKDPGGWRGPSKAVEATLDNMKYIFSFKGPEMNPAATEVHYPVMDTDIDELVAGTGSVQERVETAAAYVTRAVREFPGAEKYLKACEFLVENKKHLGEPVDISLHFVDGKEREKYAPALQILKERTSPSCCDEEVRRIER